MSEPARTLAHQQPSATGVGYKSGELVHDRVVQAHRQIIRELVDCLEHFTSYLTPHHKDCIESAKRIVADDPLNVDARPSATTPDVEKIAREVFAEYPGTFKTFKKKILAVAIQAREPLVKALEQAKIALGSGDAGERLFAIDVIRAALTGTEEKK